MVGPSGLARYLKEARERILGGTSELYHVVIGNQAGDADTIVSSVTLSYFMHLTRDSTGGPEHAHAAVLPIRRRDMSLRPETALLLQGGNIDQRDLVFSDEVSLHDLHKAGKLRLTLVDHNALENHLGDLDEAVESIVDHHQDQGKYPWVKGDKRVIAFDPTDGGIPGVASTCTMVAEKFLSKAPDGLDPTVSRLLLGVILLDSANLDPKAHKATQRDIDVVNALKERVGGDVNPDQLFQLLVEAKFDRSWWDSLSTHDALRLDYKQWEATRPNGATIPYGLSSVLVSLQDILSKSDLDESMASYYDEQGVVVFGILSFVTSPELRRELAVYCSKDRQKLGQKVVERLCHDPAAEFLQLRLDEEKSRETRVGRLWCFEQGNAVASRKQVEPVFRLLLENLDDADARL